MFAAPEGRRGSGMADDGQMFTVRERDRVRARLLALAEADVAISGAAITGSHAADGGDEWSDIDLAIAVRGPLHEALDRWTDWLYRDFDAVHRWDLPAGATVYRVFLLPGSLEADIAFAPEACLRLSYPPSSAKRAHLLPSGLIEPLEAALVASLGPAELTRAMSAAAAGLARELEPTDPSLAARLNPMLADLTASAPVSQGASANPGAAGGHYQS